MPTKEEINKFITAQKVCSHLAKSIKSNSKIKPIPYAIDFLDDSYDLTWYCDECVKKYHLPEKGVFLYHFPEEDEEITAYVKKLGDLESLEFQVSKLNGFKVSDNYDNSPFADFSKDEAKKPSLFSKTLFDTLSGLNDEKVEHMVEKALMVPFGTEVKSDE
ncbi:hypothetical protein ACROAE_07250 [Shewanella sp. MF05960]|uniref:hypothetical protein n=1 Tax=Shewanella sp. MF05960 TaxID=3434874 RepID=UPI003D7982F2